MQEANVLKALVQAYGDEPDIRDATCGIIFLGTPHYGVGGRLTLIADLVALLTTPFFGSNKMLLRALRWHGENLINLHDRFMSIYRQRTLIYSFYETTHTLFRGFLPIGLVRHHPLSPCGVALTSGRW